jgi:hypothetical protein
MIPFDPRGKWLSQFRRTSPGKAVVAQPANFRRKLRSTNVGSNNLGGSHMKRLFVLAIMAVGAATLTGCVEYREDVVVRHSGYYYSSPPVYRERVYYREPVYYRDRGYYRYDGYRGPRHHHRHPRQWG